MGLGPPSLVIDTLKRYEAAGVTDLCIRFAGSDQIAQLEHFIDAVVPVFSERSQTLKRGYRALRRVVCHQSLAHAQEA